MGKRLIALSLAVFALFLWPFELGKSGQNPGMSDENVLPVAHAAVSLTGTAQGAVPEGPEGRTVWVTAYASTPEETDNTPFITASNTHVHDGVLAANFLPFGTKVLIPALFGNKVFTVEDRMKSTKTNFVDVWMPTKQDAIDFGISRAEIVVLHED